MIQSRYYDGRMLCIRPMAEGLPTELLRGERSLFTMPGRPPSRRFRFYLAGLHAWQPRQDVDEVFRWIDVRDDCGEDGKSSSRRREWNPDLWGEVSPEASVGGSGCFFRWGLVPRRAARHAPSSFRPKAAEDMICATASEVSVYSPRPRGACAGMNALPPRVPLESDVARLRGSGVDDRLPRRPLDLTAPARGARRGARPR